MTSEVREAAWRLLPCPFCGEQQRLQVVKQLWHDNTEVEAFRVVCDGCEVQAMSAIWLDDAVARWQSRVAPAEHADDDGDEPLTVAWAKSQCDFCGEDRDGYVEVLSLDIYQFDDWHTCESDVRLKTRRDFRELCRLLSVKLPPDQEQPKSRSVLRREAAQRGEEPPEFSKHIGQEKK